MRYALAQELPDGVRVRFTSAVPWGSAANVAPIHNGRTQLAVRVLSATTVQFDQAPLPGDVIGFLIEGEG